MITLEEAKKILTAKLPEQAAVMQKSNVAERYYAVKNDILSKATNVPPDGVKNPIRNADNRIPFGFYNLLVNQKAAYLFTSPPVFDTGDDALDEKIADILGDGFSKKCKKLCIDASNAGIAWLHYWIDDKNTFRYGVVHPAQIIPIWTDEIDPELIAIIRAYAKIDGNKSVDIYEIWNDTSCSRWEKPADVGLDSLVASADFEGFFELGQSEAPNIMPHKYGRPPFIPFPNNDLQSSDLDLVKALIDCYDKTYSGFINDLEDIQEVIFILTGYKGTDMQDFLQNLKYHKAISLDDPMGEGKSGVETLTVNLPVDAREKLLTITRKAIFDVGQGIDPQPEKFGQASGVALKYLYALLEQKAGLHETEFRLGFSELIKAIAAYLGKSVQRVQQTWTRTAIRNEAELAGICSQSVGIISRQTILKNHPFVDNPEDEEKQLDKERQSEDEDYKPPGHDD